MKYLKEFWNSSLIAKIVLSALGILTFFLLVSLTLNTNYSENLTKAESENSSIIDERDELLAQVDEQKIIINETQSNLEAVQNDFNEYKESMAVYEELAEEEAQNKLEAEKQKQEEREKEKAEKKEKELAEKKAEKEREEKEKKEKKAEQERKEQEKKEAEEKKQEEEKQKQAEEEAKGYETGLTYEDLARNPDDHLAKKVTFYGRVLQVMEGEGLVQIRLAVDDNYNNVIIVEISDDIISDGRLLEDDFITVKGLSFGLYEYTATLGQVITVPAVIADIVER